MIDNVAVVGAGTMGRGIVWALARAGVRVVFKEISPDAAKRSLELLGAELDHEIERWGLTKGEKTVILSRVQATTNTDDLATASVLIEAIRDHLDLKQAVFASLDRRMPPAMVFVTNTSSLSITELAQATTRPDRFVGMHFAMPVQKRPLVEIVRGLKTSDQTVALVRELAGLMGKTAVEVFEYPGFLTTRLILPYLNEAMHIVLEGVASAEDVDTAMKLAYDFPIGPLAMADKMGLDEVMLWMEHLFHELGELKYRPCPLLRKMVRAGRLGVKTGEGFFRYDASGAQIHADKGAPSSKEGNEL
ncbi:MAG: 3-hydroxyacyl-CoA dehydrogenase NAD-binding domain-containing protein [Candidatus Sumerlaeota bacterium]|nr:3-hydroxyacyl-CoA dehydrogenase NAD-binding domain-containing protein [Candidatus Sumerlaeota bacterium]